MIQDLLMQFVLGGARLLVNRPWLLSPTVGWRGFNDAKAALRWVAYTDPTQYESAVQEHMKVCDECSGRNFFRQLNNDSTVN